jgi:hypothetical protein
MKINLDVNLPDYIVEHAKRYGIDLTTLDYETACIGLMYQKINNTRLFGAPKETRENEMMTER